MLAEAKRKSLRVMLFIEEFTLRNRLGRGVRNDTRNARRIYRGHSKVIPARCEAAHYIASDPYPGHKYRLRQVGRTRAVVDAIPTDIGQRRAVGIDQRH